MNFDPITLAMANAHCDSKGGYTVPAKKYTFDGNIEGKPIMDMGDFVMVQISGDVVDFSTVQTITVNNLTVSVDEFQVGKTDVGVAIGIDNSTYVILLKTGGVFVRYEEGVDCVREVACKETIVPIDKKYLPGVCLPVVELSTNFTDGAACTTEENAVLKKAFEANTPIVVRCNIVVGDVTYTDCSSVWNRMIVGDICSFVIQIGKILQIYSIDNGATWGCLIE